MTKYAAETGVSSEQSRAEIERTLQRYGHLVTFSESVGGCWAWQGTITDQGYGRASVTKTRSAQAHRLFYEIFRGPIPEELVLDHLCHTTLCVGGPSCPHRRCVNPAHLIPTERGHNARRASSGTNRLRAEGRCKRGHEMTPENTYVSPKGQVQCRECRSFREARRVRAHA